MLNSRKIEDLHPVLQALCKRHIDACRKRGINIIVTSTLRDQEYQEKLYSQGRTAPGPIVTNMKLIGPHGFGLAYDVVPVVNGRAIWEDDRLWRIIGEEGKKLGLTWGGDWKSIVDKPHFEYTEGLKAEDLRSGKRPSWWDLKQPETLTFTEAVKILRDKGIINSPNYWLENAAVGKQVKGEYAADLIIKTAIKFKG